MSFVERHGLWTGEQARAAKAAALAIKKHKLELVRFSFADQHGVLRGKTLIAARRPAIQCPLAQLLVSCRLASVRCQ